MPDEEQQGWKTVRIPEELWRQAKQAALNPPVCTLQEVIEEALRQYLNGKDKDLWLRFPHRGFMPSREW